MTDRSIMNKSRRDANNLMRSLHPEIDWHINCVHHKDRNPLNNDLDNLQIINKSEHTQLHCAGIKCPRPRRVKKIIKKHIKKAVIHQFLTNKIIEKITPERTDPILRCGHYVSENCECWQHYTLINHKRRRIV